MREFRIANARPVEVEGTKLPPTWIRLGGHNFSDDIDFLASAEQEIDRLEDGAGLRADSRLLDIGCGVGRLAIGLKRRYGTLSNYTGIDVDRARIRWCQKHIDADAFVHLDLANARYNPSGAAINEHFRFDLPGQSVDVIYLFSVFSHMETDDVRAYLREFRRLLSPEGRGFLTAFLESGVPEMVVNPADYTPVGDWSGPLHCVRYDRAFFEMLVADAGLTIETFHHRSDRDGQSCVILRPDHASATDFQPPL
ncbi:MAG TPA: class I SAM-dependent methyltransferase [Solirubrobacterales bacterium]|nr:class I SAM-dependent methyltransferase [Solirubrobacterales bacterium]